jgi:hypothetical protein
MEMGLRRLRTMASAASAGSLSRCQIDALASSVGSPSLFMERGARQRG